MKSAVLITLLAILGLQGKASASPLEAAAPLKGVKIPIFTAQGYRDLMLAGEEARLINADRYDVSQMHLTFFSGTAEEKIDTIIISRQASFFPSKKIATGTQGVRLIQEGVGEMSGDRWSYDDAQKKVVIEGRVKVIFQYQIKDILK